METFCDNPDILSITLVITNVINIIKIVVPIVLLLFLIIKVGRMIFFADEKELSELKSSAVKQVIAAALIFFIPTLVAALMTIIDQNNQYQCLLNTTPEYIQYAYEKRASTYIFSYATTYHDEDYDKAMASIYRLDDPTKAYYYKTQLQEIKIQVDSEKPNYDPYLDIPIQTLSSYTYKDVNYRNFHWTYYSSKKGPAKKYYSSITSYAIWAPDNIEDLNGVSLPFIYYMHGYGEIEEKLPGNYFVKNGNFPRILNNWNEYHLDPIPAIVIAPHAPNDFLKSRNLKTMNALIQYAKDTYNIDSSNIILMGHSMGADDTIIIPYKKHNYDVFSAYVLFGPSSALDKSPYSNKSGVRDYFASKKIICYDENKSGMKFFKNINKTDSYRFYSHNDHMKISKTAMIEDLNHDGVSDLMQWLFGENANTK